MSDVEGTAAIAGMRPGPRYHCCGKTFGDLAGLAKHLEDAHAVYGGSC